jgi:hypothetical protein
MTTYNDTIETLAIQYLTRPSLPCSTSALKTLDTFARWRADAVYHCSPAGFYAVYVPEENPYRTAKEMIARVIQTNSIRVSTLNNTSPAFSEKTNALVRMAHDVFDHVILNNGFSVPEEVRAFHNVLTHFEEYCEQCDHGTVIGSYPAPDEYVYCECVNILMCEFALQPIAAAWLGGYGSTRAGLSFSQRVVDANDLRTLLDTLLA